jgi:hypothetical protein
MNHSESISKLSTALVAFHSKMGKVSKDSVNPYFNSKYASLSTILSAVTPVLTEAGLSIVQMPTGENELQTTLIHSSGEWISSTMKLAPIKSDPQAQGSAITYARRYAVGAILSLNIDEDDDANAATHGRQSAPVTQANTPARTPASTLPATLPATLPTNGAQNRPQNGDRPWLNVTDRSGEINDLGRNTAGRIASGDYSWEALYSTHRLSTKDKAALEKAVLEAKQAVNASSPFDDIEDPLPF